jgi:hypothetical protein
MYFGFSDARPLVHEINAQYWTHCALFSCTRQPSLEVIIELKDILAHAIGGEPEFVCLVVKFNVLNTDSLVSTSSTVPYAMADLQQMLDLTDRAVSLYNDVDDQNQSELGGLSRIVFILMTVFSKRPRSFS